MKALYGLCLGLSLCVPGWAEARSGVLRSHSILQVEIENKRNAEGRKIPDDSVPDLREQLLAVIVNLHLFRQVGDYTDSKVTAPAGEAGTVLLRLRITGYTGAQNNSGVTAMAHFIDQASGKELLQEKVTAQLHYDQGALSGALRKLARSTAELVKNCW